MKQVQYTFKRKEMKYLLNEKTYKILNRKIEDKLIVDEYGKTTICNIYFDTPNYLLIRSSQEKPVYKEKLRLRSYGVSKAGDEVFVELKKKYKGVVYKRREKMELQTAEGFLYGYNQLDISTQITKEINWFLQYYNDIEPTMYISYDRIALYCKENPELRVTFDSNILWREDNLFLENGVYGTPILGNKDVIMEIKIPGSMPMWLSHILDELEIYPVSFSKYGKGYEQLRLLDNTKIDYKLDGRMLEGEIKYA